MQIRILLLMVLLLGGTLSSRAGTVGEALDFTQVQWLTGGDGVWSAYPGDPTEMRDGVDVAFADVYPFQQAWVETTVPGPGAVEFWWALSSHADQSRFEFSINGVIQSNLVTETGWQKSQFSLPAGQLTLRWTYRTLDTEDDFAWLDGVVLGLSGPPYVRPDSADFAGFTGSNYLLRALSLGAPTLAYQWYQSGLAIPGANSDSLTLANFSKPQAGAYSVVVTNVFGAITAAVANISFFADAIEAPGLLWSTYGDALWFTQTNVTHDGVDAAQTGALFPDRTQWLHSQLEATVTGPGTVTWWWRTDVDAEEGGLVFFLDGAYQTHLNGVGGAWQQAAQIVSDGDHKLLWQFEVVWDGGFGTLRGWMDEVVFTPTTNRPRIQISRTGSQIVISWPADYTGYNLEAIEDPGSSNWNPVALTGVNTATLFASGSQQFFRLRHP